LSDLLLVVWSYAVLQLMAVAAWPWLLLLLGSRDQQNWRHGHPVRVPALEHEYRPPPDLAVGLAKSLGLVLISYVTWLLGFVGVSVVAPAIWLVWAAIGLHGYVVARLRPGDLVRLLGRHRRAILVGEAVFLVVFLSLCRVRALTPDATFHRDERGRVYDASASEKFTNLALLTSLHRERDLPPRDTWLAGYPINYYYFGHFEWATFCKMALISPRVGFNIGQAALFALIAANAFSLVLHLTRRVGAGLLAAYAVAIMGTPYGFLQLLLQGLGKYNFWEASRIVEGTIVNGEVAGPITEFPYFTFILGDFHAHGMSFHSYLLALAIAFLFPFRRAGPGDLDEAKPHQHVTPATVQATLLLAMLLAVTAMTNTWDAPSLGVLMAAILVIRAVAYRRFSLAAVVRALALCALIVFLALLFLQLHLARFELPVGVQRDPEAFYIGPLKWLGSSHLSEFKDYLVHFGFLLVPLTLAIHVRLVAHVRRCDRAKRRRREALLAGSYLIALYVFLFAQRYFLLYFLAAMIGYAIVLAVAELRERSSETALTGQQTPSLFAAIAILSAVAFFLSLFAEVWVVEDGYAGLWERYNTVFKTYNVVWLLYGIAFAAAIGALLPRLDRVADVGHQGRARADLDEDLDARSFQALDRLGEAHGLTDVVPPILGIEALAGDLSARDRRDERNLRGRGREPA